MVTAEAMAARPILLPPGLTLNSTGQLSGTPTTAGTFNAVVVTVTDSSVPPQTAQNTYTITIAPQRPLTLSRASPLPSGGVGSFYSENLSVSGGTGSGYNWSVTAGALPIGLSLSSGSCFGAVCQISGKPTTAGQSSFTMQVTDSGGDIGSIVY